MFDIGDRFKVIENGLTGLICGVNKNFSNKGMFVELEVMWDHENADPFSRSKKRSYNLNDVQNLWQNLGGSIKPQPVTVTLPIPQNGRPTHYTIHRNSGPDETVKLDECDHNWKTYEGFSSSYEYCTKCDRKKQ